MTNPFYTPTGNPGTGAAGLSALMRAEFLAISTAFDILPRFTTTGLFDTIFNQTGSYTFTLPPAPGTLALLSDVATEAARTAAVEAARAMAAEAGLSTTITAEATTRAGAVSGEAARATAAESALTAAIAARQAALGYTPVQQGTGFGQLANTVKIGWTGTYLGLTVDGTDEGLFITTLLPHGFALDATVNAETARATAAEAVAIAAIGTEANTRAAADSALTTAVAGKGPNLGFTPVQQGTGIGQLANTVKIGWNGGNLGLTVDASDEGLFVTTRLPNGFALDTTVNAETARATAAEAVAIAAISTEANTRAAADNALTTAVNGKQASLGFTPVQQSDINAALVPYTTWAATDANISSRFQPVSPAQPYVRNAWGGNLAYFGYQAGKIVAQIDATYFGQVPTQVAPGNFIRNGDDASLNAVNIAGNAVVVGGIFPSSTATGSGMYLYGDAGNRVINWTSDGWKLSFNVSTGALAQFNPAGTALLRLDNAGNLAVTGIIAASNVSDERTKRAITPYRSGLDAVIGLEPISYEYNGRGGTTDTGKTRWGVSAQQAQAFLPECVHETIEPATDPTLTRDPVAIRFPGQLSFDEQPLLYAMVNAFRDVAAELVAVKARLAVLEAR